MDESIDSHDHDLNSHESKQEITGLDGKESFGELQQRLLRLLTQRREICEALKAIGIEPRAFKPLRPPTPPDPFINRSDEAIKASAKELIDTYTTNSSLSKYSRSQDLGEQSLQPPFDYALQTFLDYSPSSGISSSDPLIKSSSPQSQLATYDPTENQHTPISLHQSFDSPPLVRIRNDYHVVQNPDEMASPYYHKERISPENEATIYSSPNYDFPSINTRQSSHLPKVPQDPDYYIHHCHQSPRMSQSIQNPISPDLKSTTSYTVNPHCPSITPQPTSHPLPRRPQFNQFNDLPSSPTSWPSIEQITATLGTDKQPSSYDGSVVEDSQGIKSTRKGDIPLRMTPEELIVQRVRYKRPKGEGNRDGVQK